MAIDSAVQMSSMLLDMHQNLGYTPEGQEAKRSLQLGRVLAFNHGYARSIARAIVTGTPQPTFKPDASLQGAVTNFLLAEIAALHTRGSMTFISSAKNLCKWALREGADDAISIVVIETLMRRFPTPELKEEFLVTDEYKAYLEVYAPFLEVVGEINP
jgi:hypothetical protein